MGALRFGELTVEAVTDGYLVADPAELLPDVPLEALAVHGSVEDGRLRPPLTTWAVRAAGRLLLVDTGMGPSPRWFAGEVGALPASLESVGIDPTAVDAVLFTHLHPDHVGWNFTERGGRRVPTFPNARYVVHHPEWEHWAERPFSFIRECVAPLAETGQLDLVADDHEVVPGVRLLATPGHTPGHVSVLVSGGGEGGLITGDAASHPAQLEHPEWSSTSDEDRAHAAATRAALVERLERDGLVALGGHFPAPHAGRLLRIEQRRVYRAVGVAV